MLYFNKMFRRRLIFILLFSFLLTSLSLGQRIPGQLIVKFKPGVAKLPKGLSVSAVKAAAVSAASVRALNAKYNVSTLKQLYSEALRIRPDWKFLENDYIIIFPKEYDLGKVTADYQRDPNVEKAEPDSAVHAFDVQPDDPHFKNGDQWGLTKIEAPKGWLQTTGTSENIVAVLDTGINYNHEDFQGGKVDLADAVNFVAFKSDKVTPYSSTEVIDDFGHGSAVSGVISAVTNNSIGIAGLDWNARILPLKVLDDEGGGDMSNVSAALAYAAALRKNGKKIVAANMSLGQENSGTDKYVEEDPSQIKENCILAYKQGIVLAAAAGNKGVDYNSYPAYYKPYVVAVAATDQDDKRSIWTASQSSNYASWVDVSAPGTSIWAPEVERIDSLNNLNPDWGTVKYSSWNGTSLATPFVAGLAALISAANPLMTNVQIINQIKTFTDNIYSIPANSSYVGKLGTGRINAFRALGGIISNITSPASGEFVSGVKEVRGTANGWNFASYEVDVLQSGSLESVIAGSSVSVESGLLATWDTNSFNGAQSLRLNVFAADGSSSEADVSVIVDNTTPEAAITSPAAGASVKDSISIIGKASDQYLDHYTLAYGAGSSPSSFQNIGTFYVSVESGALGTWETAGLSGPYTLRLLVVDKAGNSSVESVALTILSASPTKQVIAQGTLAPTYALPNPFNNRPNSAEMSFAYSLAGNFDTTIYLFDLNGNLIWRNNYAAGENGGKAGSNSPTWNGQDLYGVKVANGVYIYQITAGQKIIARGKVIVL